MAGIDVSKIPKCVTIESKPEVGNGNSGPVKTKPHDGGVKTKPTHEGGGHPDIDSVQRRGGSSGQQLFHPNGSSNGAPGKPGIKPPSSGGVSRSNPGIIVKPCPPENKPETIQI